MGIHEKNILKRKSFGFRKKSFGSDTDTQIGPWFWFMIPKPGLGCTLDQIHITDVNFLGLLYFGWETLTAFPFSEKMTETCEGNL